MNKPTDQIAAIEEMVRQFWTNFKERPGMLGNPEELSSTVFYIDQLEYLMLGGSQESYWELSWISFLIDKKLIVGARNILSETLPQGADAYTRLQELRREYLGWRSARGWPERS